MADIDYKVCKDCGVELCIENCYFSNVKNTFLSRCKSCYAIHRKPISERYVANNPDKIKESTKKQGLIRRDEKKVYAKEYHLKNREKANASNKLAYFKNRDVNILKRKEWYQKNKEKHAAARAKYELENKDRLRAARRKWENNRLQNDINYRLHKTLSGRVREELKGHRKKTDRTEALLGCTIYELKVFIEGLMLDGMTWDNWKANGWHIDHRIPLSCFNLENENCRKLAFSYKNLQPLWSEDNLKKKNFYAHKMAS